MTYLLLAEKPSAAKNFAKAFGGMSGTFEGQPYKIQTLFGHMLEFVEPHEMVDQDEAEQFKSWSPETMPWDIRRMNWRKQPQKSKNMKTGKMTSKASGIADVKKAAQGCSAIVIATDKDPSGEGQLIGWEVIQAIGWKGDVKRLYFTAENDKDFQEGFRNIVDLPDYHKDGEYVKADVRSRWDFASMQLTRLSTDAARSQGYNAVVRQGRLKSVMTKLVADQLALVKAYKKKPYYEVKFKDDNGNTFTRKFDPDTDSFRFDSKAEAEADMKQYSDSAIVQDSKTRKNTAPGKLLDLGGLASILATKGYASKEVLSTYQKMYEAGIVSYPRTEDKEISTEQFKEMLPLVDKIAAVVGADTSLLTHRTARSTHVKNGGAHGANRPGLKVPKSLNDVAAFGPSAKAIYEILAKNFLAMFGEDYVYDSIKGHVEKYPSFQTTVSVPVDLGFKAIFDADAETSDDDDKEDDTSKGLGKMGSPIVAEGANKKPPHPSQKWLEKQLSRYDVGTGATRVNTLTEVTNGKTALLLNKKGKLDLTKTGEIAAVLLDGSHIGDPAVTEKLFKSMKDVGEFKVKPMDVVDTVSDIVKHDKEVFYRNATKLKEKIGEPDASMAQTKAKPKTEGVFAPTGEKIRFNKEWGGHTFTDDEIQKLLAGETITIKATTKTGKQMTVDGSLQLGEFKGKPFWGFQRKNADDYTIADAPFPKEWSGYTFTKDDEKKLRAGEKIEIEAISKKTGNPFKVDVTFQLKEFKGNKSWGIEPHFAPRVDPSTLTGATAPFPSEWSGHTFTKDEEAKLRAGEKIEIEAISKKTGKPFKVNVTFQIKEYKGNKSWGIEPHFDAPADPSSYTRANAPFKAEFSGYKLTQKEIDAVRAGSKILVTAKSKKTGKPYQCNLTLDIREFNGRKSWGLVPHFD